MAKDIVYQPMSRLVKEMDFANGLNTWNTYTQGYELNILGLNDGATAVIDRSHARSDDLNLTGITDAVTAGYSQTFSYSAANRLISAVGTYGTKGYSYDGVGNRIEEQTTPSGGSLTTETYNYLSTNNRISGITVGASPVRTFGYDAQRSRIFPTSSRRRRTSASRVRWNMTSDVRSCTTYAYTYNKAGRLATASYTGSLRGSYTYNGSSQLAKRVLTNLGASNGTTEFVHDHHEAGICRLRYVLWRTSASRVRRATSLPRLMAAVKVSGNTCGCPACFPKSGRRFSDKKHAKKAGYAGTDLPLAVVDGFAATPVLYHVHTDHISRPVLMTGSSKAQVWSAIWGPFGQAHSITGSASTNLRFPGQWYQLEAGLHYNWHRHYDPSLGRYTQPDPLGFVDGPSVYAYAGSDPQSFVDPDGRNPAVGIGIGLTAKAISKFCAKNPRLCNRIKDCIRNPKGCTQRICNVVRKMKEKSCGNSNNPQPGCKDKSVTPELAEQRLRTAELCLATRDFMTAMIAAGACKSDSKKDHSTARSNVEQKARRCHAKCAPGTPRHYPPSILGGG